MEIKNFILLNMLKQQLLDVHKTFRDDPKLLDDPAVRKGYDALQSVTNVYEMVQWRRLINALGLSYLSIEYIEREKNVLAELDDIASRANMKVLTDFIEFMCSFEPALWDEKLAENCELVRTVQKMAGRDYDVHIILVQCNGHWVAIGNDADRLFEIFGWQTSTVYNGEEDVSYMYVSDYGMKVIRGSEFSIKTLFLNDEVSEDEVFFSDSFNEDMVCANQQLIDYIRLLMRSQSDLRDFTSQMASFYLPKSGYDYLVNSELTIDSNKVSVMSSEDYTETVLAEGRSWRLDEVGLPYLMNIRPLLGEA